MDKHRSEGTDRHDEPRKSGRWRASPFWAAATIGAPLVLLSALGLQVPVDLRGLFALAALAVLLAATWLARGIWWVHQSNEDDKDDPWDDTDVDRLTFWLQMGVRRNIQCRFGAGGDSGLRADQRLSGRPRRTAGFCGQMLQVRVL